VSSANQRARPGRGASGIDRDHLEINPRAELEQPVVGAHERMFSAGHRGDPQSFLHPARALVERARRDDQVVDFP
jgi:hypothetical protein